jgi:Holliday junction resolvase RusA-like endonuclease
MKIVVFGEVKPQGRPRGTIIKGRIVFYEQKETKEYKKQIANVFKLNYPDHIPFESCLNCTIKVYKAIPKSFGKEKRMKALSDKIRPTTKPDVDNYAKLICDALNGIAYVDDSQIVTLEIKKHYSDVDKLEIIIEQVNYE